MLIFPLLSFFYSGGLYGDASAAPSYNLTNFVHQSVLSGSPAVCRLAELPTHSIWVPLGPLRTQQQRRTSVFFGGEPSKVTIWDESSSALSVGKHLIAYGGQDAGLFRGAIIESGGMAEEWPYNVANMTAYMADLYQNLTDTLNITSTEVYSGSGLGPWLTVVDGDFLQDGPSESLAHSHFNPNVTVMYTTFTDEASVFLFGPAETIRTIEILYPNVNAVGLPTSYEPLEDDTESGLQYKRGVAFFTAAVETSSRRLTVDTWAATLGAAPAYPARLNLLTLDAAPALGAYHSAELAFIFNNVDSAEHDNAQLQETSLLTSRM
ncbi:Pyrethroid hydrolase Ces2e [Cytospora mali]|uniref:Pyrethroid hydrolase Ces2e n=1 Tax=Cytospora mali TaxID=578113 RepID=A0A194W290_CYTMA|nr:Pyrethroid hydrolase Ces2e [Valsa mali]